MYFQNHELVVTENTCSRTRMMYLTPVTLCKYQNGFFSMYARKTKFNYRLGHITGGLFQQISMQSETSSVGIGLYDFYLMYPEFFFSQCTA